jgi:conjugative transfer signal peptidase TraF
MATGLACLLIGMPPVGRTHPLLVWNATASAPVGLYSVDYRTPIRRGDMVIARLPQAVRTLADRRHYIPATVPLVKQVAAGPGEEVCALAETIFIDGRPAATRRQRDGTGRSLPSWNGCRTLRMDQLFLLMPSSPLSFDGRYFGISRRAEIVGRATLLWHW